MKLPNEVVTMLNELGLGGRLVYVPLVRKNKKDSDVIYEDMLLRLRQGKLIDFDQYKNIVSLKTLYRLKAKAISEVKGDNNNGK